MAQEVINTGSSYGDPDANKIRDAFEKVNNNFSELYPGLIVLYEIGAWDMDATASLQVILPSDGYVTGDYLPTILGVTIMDDNLPTTQHFYPLNYCAVGGVIQGDFYMSKKYIVELARLGGGIFDSTSFNAASGNRGYIAIRWAYVGE